MTNKKNNDNDNSRFLRDDNKNCDCNNFGDNNFSGKSDGR